jgi:Spy/CpxP family protein refolding chaperone
MRTHWRWALVLAVGAVWVAPARPGEDEAVPSATTMDLLLLRQKSVQQELKIAPALAKKIIAFTNMEYAAAKKALKLDEKELKKKFEELREKNRKFLQDNLSEAQRKRLRQIRLQVTGLHQLNQSEVAKALNLTKAQREKFKAMQKEARNKVKEILAAKEGKNEKLAKLRKEINKQILAILTDEQKAKAKEAVGEPFKGELLFEEPEGPTSWYSPAWRAEPWPGAARPPVRAARAAFASKNAG